MKKMDKTDAQWKSELSATEYQILRKEGTEASFSHPHNKEYRKGIFACVACSTPLFTSDMKFDSGTGWPSFYECIEGAFKEKTDRKFFMTRTEYHCATCGGHHGHVFPDGPNPTGLRYCNNGTALKFIPED
jgi:peptide-methionine (R)-S-oxide reductase